MGGVDCLFQGVLKFSTGGGCGGGGVQVFPGGLNAFPYRNL